MLDAQLLRKEPEKIKAGIAKKNADPDLVDEFLTADEIWRKATLNLEDLRAKQKKAASEKNIEEGKRLKGELKELEEKANFAEEKRNTAWVKIPNPPLDWVISGKSEADNSTLREAGKKPDFSFPPADYVVLAEKLGLVDNERAAKVSGSRFAYLLGDMVRLEFALGQFLFETISDKKILAEIAKKAGITVSDKPFIPVIPPVLIKKESMSAMGYMERGGEEIYRTAQDDLYLVGTSEQSIGPMHSGEILEAKDLPLRYVGFSTCFRREAGSYGKDTKGILRVHQFNKFEMFSFTLPETSNDEHKFLLAIEEYLMSALEIPYRVLNICSADLGDPAAAKYDIEAWLPGQNGGKGEYRETHSTSNTTDFQARRLNIRYKTPDGPKFLHMLNGTAFSERPLIAIIENFQTKESKIKIPKVLQKYLGKEEIE
ncbi:MAG: serine--tRNA ligase [Candidatus Liptonbacteria bacterium]|nr:serine--tRNA ligase [Candidatus Liptonbacteria bacterium]